MSCGRVHQRCCSRTACRGRSSSNRRATALLLGAAGLSILFFGLIVIDLLALEGEPLGGLTDHPFLAVGVIARRAEGIVGNHVVDEICCALIADLVGFTRTKKKRVATRYVAGPSFMPHTSAP